MNNSALYSKRVIFALALLLVAGCHSGMETPAPAPQPQSTGHASSEAVSKTAKPARAASTSLHEAAAKPAPPLEGQDWESMFDGKTLAGWRPIDFAGGGEVQCESGLIALNTGSPFTGITYTNEFPKMNFEVVLDAMRVMGSDFFCGLTVPVADSHCSLIVGGWGGSLLGISSLDRMDASENETSKYMNFETGRWYRIRLRITAKRIEAWVDNEKLVNVDTTDRKISLRPGDIELSVPFGITAWQTTSFLRGIKMRHVSGPAGPLSSKF